MPCGLNNPVGCLGDIVGSAAGGLVSSAWNDVCKSFADAASTLLTAFAKAFIAIPPIDVNSAGIRSVYGISIGIGAIVCALLLLGQVLRTALTHDGSALARGLTGVGKAVLACLLTLAVAGAGLRAADELTALIITDSFGSVQGLSGKIAAVFAWQQGLSGSLLLVMAIAGILLVVVLWFELLLRNAAVAVLVATAPIAAAGQASDTARSWWPKLVSAGTQLIILKPVIALVFAIGFGLAGHAQDLSTLLTGLLILLLAALAWPAIARFFTFATVQAGGGAGLAGLLGFAAGTAASTGSSGVPPDQFSQAAEARTTTALADRGAFTPGPAGTPGANASTAPGAATGGTPGAAGAAGAAGLAAGLAQRAVNSLAGRMEQIAGHAGLPGPAPHARPAGQNQPGTYPPAPGAPARQPDPRGEEELAVLAGTWNPEQDGPWDEPYADAVPDGDLPPAPPPGASPGRDEHEAPGSEQDGENQ